MATDSRAYLAARNNAEWCDLVCRTHGIVTAFHDDVWLSGQRSPPMYPDAVTLAEVAAPGRVLDRVDASAGCSVKDSFASLDLSPAGMRVLFEAEWIYRPPVDPAAGTRAGEQTMQWSEVRTPGELRTWAACHGGGDVIRPALLDDPRVAIMLARDRETVVGGVIANRSAAVVGVSNVFTTLGSWSVWAEVAAVVSARFPGLPLVGYEPGSSRAAAEQDAGFVGVGALRVWLRD